MALSKGPAGDDHKQSPESMELAAYLWPDCYSRFLGDKPKEDAKSIMSFKNDWQTFTTASGWKPMN